MAIELEWPRGRLPGWDSRSMSWDHLAWVAGLSDADVRMLDAGADVLGAAGHCFSWFHHLVRVLAGAADRGEQLPVPVLQAAARAIDLFPGIVCGAWCIGAALVGEQFSPHYHGCWQRMWAAQLEAAGYVEGNCLGFREIGRSYPRPIVFARPAPRPQHPVTLFRASNHPGRFGLSWTSCYLSAEDVWLPIESRVAADGGKDQRSIYRRETAPGDVLARAFYPQPQYEGHDQWILDPSVLNDATVRKMP